MYLPVAVFFTAVLGSVALDSHADDFDTSARFRLDSRPFEQPAALPATSAPESTVTATRQRLVQRARELTGTPYRWGGMSEASGFDCSGLLVFLFKNEAGVALPRTTHSMLREDFQRVSRHKLQPGDAVFFSHNGQGRVSHVGLYIGDNQFIHAPSTGKTVRIDSLDNRYWNARYTSARRFDVGVAI